MSNVLKQIVAGTPPYATDIDQFRQVLSGTADVGMLSTAIQTNTPIAPTLTAGTAGVLNGTYKYQLIAVTGWIENNNTMHVSGFAPGAEASISVTSKVVTVTIPSLVTPVIAYLVYRTVAGGASGSEKYCGYTTGPTSFTDNVADSSLGASMPSWLGTAIPSIVPTLNTTGTSIISGASLSAYGQILSTQGITGSSLIPTGLTGATATSRYVGATTSGAPTSGTFNVGDFIVDQTGTFWVCAIAGSPGTWTKPTNTGYQMITTTSTFTVPLGVTRIYVQIVGGGGGGAGGWGDATGSDLKSGVAGGGGGGYAATWMSVTPGQQITATIGAGGTGGAGGSSSGSGDTQGGSGGTGGISAFNGVGAYGGAGGIPTNTSGPGAAGGIGVGCPLVVTGGAGGYWTSYNASGAPGGTAANGGIAGGYGTGGTGGSHSLGYSPAAGSPGQAGTNGAVIIIW
jgi:hypothetical protein